MRPHPRPSAALIVTIETVLGNLNGHAMTVMFDDRAMLSDLHQPSHIRNRLAQSIKLLAARLILDNREVRCSPRQMRSAKQRNFQVFGLDRRRDLRRGRKVEDVALL